MQLSIPKITGRKTGSFSIAEWCRHRRVSVSMYYKMKAEGWAPRTMSVGDRQLISAEADDFVGARTRSRRRRRRAPCFPCQ